MHTTRFLLILLAIAFLLGAGALLWQRQHRESAGVESMPITEVVPVPIMSRLEKVTISVPDINTLVTLVDGRGRFPIADASSEGTVSLSDIYAERLVQGVGTAPERHDVLAIITVNSGGTGQFTYLLLFQDSGGRLLQKSSRFLGDRIALDAITIHEATGGVGEYVVDVSIRERSAGQPMAADPTAPRIISIPVTKGLLEAEKK